MEQSRVTALYARVSTDEQAREGQSLPTQVSRLTHYALSRGLDKIEVFKDEGCSAKDMNRPELKRLVDMVQQGKVGTVCTVAVDRLSRNLLDMLQFVQLCEQHRTSFVCTAANFDTSTPIGRMTLQILAAFAEFERSMIASRVRSTMREIVKQERRHLSSAPFGYANGATGKLEIIESEAKWVRDAASMFLTGHGYRAIARWLNQSGAPRTRRGNLWSPGSVKAMLTNSVYAGVVTWGRRSTDSRGRVILNDESQWVVASGAHPPILSPKTWNSVQRRVSSARVRQRVCQTRSKLSGFIKCGHCGNRMVSRRYSNKGPNKDRRIYVCSTYQKKGGCWFNYVFADNIERQVLRCLSTVAPILEGPDQTQPLDDLSTPGFLVWLWQEAELPVLRRFLEMVLDCCIVTNRQPEEIRISGELVLPKYSKDSL